MTFSVCPGLLVVYRGTSTTLHPWFRTDCRFIRKGTTVQADATGVHAWWEYFACNFCRMTADQGVIFIRGIRFSAGLVSSAYVATLGPYVSKLTNSKIRKEAVLIYNSYGEIDLSNMRDLNSKQVLYRVKTDINTPKNVTNRRILECLRPKYVPSFGPHKSVTILQTIHDA